MQMRDDLGKPAVGIGWMLVSGVCFVAVTGIVRHLGTDLPSAQSAFLRFVFGVVFLAPAMWRMRVPAGVWPLIGVRGVFHTAAVVCWFYAMARLPVAEVTAIGYLNPVIVTIGAALIFGEALAWRRIVTIAVAIAGALVVLRPGVREILPGHFAQLAAAACFAGSYLCAKRLSLMLDAGVVVAVMSVTVTIGLLPFALWVWVPVSAVQCAWLALVAAFATGGHYAMTRAFAAAPLAVTQPVVFLQLVWATLLGWAVFGEGIDPYVTIGGAMIVASVSWLAWREARVLRAVEV